MSSDVSRWGSMADTAGTSDPLVTIGMLICPSRALDIGFFDNICVDIAFVKM